MANNGKLSDSKLVTEVHSVVIDATTIVNQYVKFVLLQEDVTLTALENLPAHQKLARQHAQFWRDDVQPNVRETLTDTITFSTVFLTKYNTLHAAIDQMKRGDAKAEEEFTAILRTLMNQLDTVTGHNQNIISNLAKFNSMLNEDIRNFKQDSQEAQIKIAGDNAEMRSIQKELDAIDEAIKRDIGLISGGVIIVWLGVAGAVDLKKQKDRQKTEEAKLALERQELRALNAVKGQINGFVNSIPPVLSAVTNLQNSWASLKSDFEELINELKKLSNTDAAAYLGAILETAKKDWNVALNEAKKLQQNFTTASLQLDSA